MPLPPYDPRTTIQNPIQSPYAAAYDGSRDRRSELSPETWAAILAANDADVGRQHASAKAAALRGPGPYAAGDGPYGIRTGKGPLGWMVSLGDLSGAIVGNAKERAAAEQLGISIATYKKLFEQAQTGILKDKYGFNPVPQGSPLTVSGAGGGMSNMGIDDMNTYPMGL